MPAPSNSHTTARLLMILTGMAVIVFLKFAQEFLIPFTLAILFSFLLTPIVLRLERWGLGRAASVVITALVAFAFVGGIGWLVVGQVLDLAGKLPEYKNNIHHKIESFQGPSSGPLSRAADTIKELNDAIRKRRVPQVRDDVSVGVASPPPLLRAPDPNAPDEEEPQKVEVVAPAPTPVDFLQTLLGPLMTYMAMLAGVVLLVIFILIEREELRDRFIRLFGEGRLNVTTTAMDDAAKRVSRFLLMQMIVNVTYGIPVAVALYFIGVPNAILWGFLATVLRFIPYIGPWIAASMPIMLSLAVFDGWTKPVLVVSIFLFLELVSNNLVEPFLYGTSTGLSLVALLMAAAFWTWLWGAVGLIVSTPITVCLVVLGRYVPQLSFLDILLTDRAVLEREVRFYQRLLANDLGEAMRVIRNAVKLQPLAEVYDSIMIPALCLAENDFQRGDIDADRHELLHDNMKELIEEMGEFNKKVDEAKLAEKTGEAAPSIANPRNSLIVTVCLPAKNQADELVGMMLAQLLAKRGFNSKSLSVKALASEMLDQVGEQQAEFVCISALPPMADMHARYLNKRLRARYPDIKSVIGVWDAKNDVMMVKERLGIASTENMVISLTSAVQLIEDIAVNILPPPPPEPAPAVAAPKEPAPAAATA